jgi:hypothetical protein
MPGRPGFKFRRVDNSLLQSVRGVHPATQPVGTCDCLPGLKTGREAGYSPPASDKIKNNGAVPPHSPIRFHAIVLN